MNKYSKIGGFNNYFLLITFENCGQVHENLYGPIDQLDIDHVAADFIREEFKDYNDDDLEEVIEDFRECGELESDNFSSYWKITKLQARSVDCS